MPVFLWTFLALAAFVALTHVYRRQIVHKWVLYGLVKIVAVAVVLFGASALFIGILLCIATRSFSGATVGVAGLIMLGATGILDRSLDGAEHLPPKLPQPEHSTK